MRLGFPSRWAASLLLAAGSLPAAQGCGDGDVQLDPVADAGMPDDREVGVSDAGGDGGRDGGMGVGDAGAPPADTGENPVAPLVYAERWRPQVHYSPPFGWMNDPNWMVEVNGVWHLYYQNNPLGDGFGFLSWGHAISDDLVRWKPVNLAIPFADRTLIFSGSAVVDERNTSGLCDPVAATAGRCVIANYTANVLMDPGFDQEQNLAISNDGGFEFRVFEGNPVLDIEDPEFRDPKIFWHAPTERWVMVVARPVAHLVSIYTSPNLVDWTFASDFGPVGATGGVWECPDLFPLPVPDQPGETRWVMKVDLNPGHVAGGSGGQYFLGAFDGTTFRMDRAPEDPPRWVDWASDFYCATTWADSPDDETRWIGWMSNWQYAGDAPTDPWRGQMTLPRRVRLERGPGGRLDLAQAPVESFRDLRVAEVEVVGDAAAIGPELADISPVAGAWEMELEVELPPGFESVVELRLTQTDAAPYATLRYIGRDGGTLELERPADGNAPVNDRFPGVARAPLPAERGRIDLRLVVDRSSIEIFAAGGAVNMTELVFPLSEPLGAELAAPPEVRFDATIWPLDSTWR